MAVPIYKNNGGKMKTIVNGRRLDYKFNKHAKSFAAKRYFRSAIQGLPDVVDLRSLCSDPEDQILEGSCSAHAAAGAVEFLELMEFRNNTPQIAQEYAPVSKIVKRVSRNFIYYGERVIDGTVDQDAGATDLVDACNVLMNQGVCREDLWPYSQDNLFTKPSDEAYADAALHKVPASFSLTTDDLKSCLHAGFPFMLGFQVYESFMSDEVAQTGYMPIPAAGDQIVGGHAVLAVGYNNYQQAFIVRNSWGAKWGMGGYFYFPYRLMNDPNMAGDFYTLRFQ
jgi:C1A family cysteine protease